MLSTISMKPHPARWAENLYRGFERQIVRLIENRGQIAQIVGTLLLFVIAAGSIQYIPFLIRWLHVNDMAFGRVVVYSLPVWIAFAIFLIWRS